MIMNYDSLKILQISNFTSKMNALKVQNPRYKDVTLNAYTSA